MSNTTKVYDKSITKYFTIEDAINAPLKTKTGFIIANERITKSGHIGRYYTVFPTFKAFLTNRSLYPHCHEILVDHSNRKPSSAGRLVFDFDIKCSSIPPDFKTQVENIITDVIEMYFVGVDTNILHFIWSTSQNPKKFSKHLTVKNLYFNDWIRLSKIFYQLFCIEWDKIHLWIRSSELIDFQIVRKNGSLRMVGSTKINGYPLIFDNENDKLTDSLIRIYLRNQREKEQLVTADNIADGVLNTVLEITDGAELQAKQFFTIDTKKRQKEKPIYPPEVYEKAFEIYNTICPDIFTKGKINGAILSLIRKKANKCLLSGKVHEKENAFCVISKMEEFYLVRFGCFRYCYKNRTVVIGKIGLDDLLITFNPRFWPPKKNKKKKKIVIV